MSYTRILRRRFTLTPTAYKYVGIVVGPVSFVEIVIGDNQGNNIILPRAMWQAFIERRADIERFVQSIALSSLSIQDLMIEIIKMHECNQINTARNMSVYEAINHALHVQILHRERIFWAVPVYTYHQRKS